MVTLSSAEYGLSAYTPGKSTHLTPFCVPSLRSTVTPAQLPTC